MVFKVKKDGVDIKYSLTADNALYLIAVLVKDFDLDTRALIEACEKYKQLPQAEESLH